MRETIFIVASLSYSIQPATGDVHATGVTILDHINTWSEPSKKVSGCFPTTTDKRVEEFVVNRGEDV